MRQGQREKSFMYNTMHNENVQGLEQRESREEAGREVRHQVVVEVPNEVSATRGERTGW